jgi:hypothetical protein
VVIFALWHTPVLFPFKLITIYVHEAAHALAGWLTGAKVEGIEVHAEEGGVTHLRGGSMWLILPAGYLGSSVFGGVLLLLGTRAGLAKWTALGLAGVMVFLLAWATNWLTRFLTLGFVGLIGVLWWLQEGAFLPYLVLFVGTMSAMYAVYDIFDDTIRRTVPQSDAYKMSQLTGIPSVVWGGLWMLFSLGMLVGVLYLGIRFSA